MTERNEEEAELSRLAEAIDLDPSPQRLWTATELGAVLRHQLAVPAQLELAAMGEPEAQRVSLLAAAQGLLLSSLGELLHHRSPPVELLVMVKDFAKANAAHPESSLPQEVAQVLYSLAIAAALVRCGQRITQLDDAKLLATLQWAAGRPWIEQRERELLEEAARSLAGKGPGTHEREGAA